MQRSLPNLSRSLSALMALISILGAMAVWGNKGIQQPGRYLIAAVVLLIAGIAWLLCAAMQRYQLRQGEYLSILVVVLLGLLLGLISSSYYCGGECNGNGFCHWDHGYPSVWLRIGACGDVDRIRALLTPRDWVLDAPSFLVDFVFWSGAGVLILFVQKIMKIDKVGDRL